MSLLLDTLEPIVSPSDLKLVESARTHAMRHGYPPIRIYDLEAGRYKETVLPYHNFDHADHTAQTAVGHALDVNDRGARVDIAGIALSAIYHDFDFTKDPELEAKKYKRLGLINSNDHTKKDKESISALAAHLFLLSHGVEDARISYITKPIRATAATRKPRTLPEKILVRSDLDTVNKDPVTFFKSTAALVREAALLSGKSVKDPVLTIGVLHDVLEKYTRNDLSFGRYESDYEGSFMVPAMHNIALIGRSALHDTLKRFGNYLYGN